LPPSSLVARFVQRAGRLHRLRAERMGRMMVGHYQRTVGGRKT
jgi:hypothetical protein